jgi:nucleoid DNA-binding protein
MEKPQSMSVKEWIIKKMSISMIIPEKVIDAVVVHQFDSANDAINLHKSVEISGFGKFFFNQKKALTQYNKLLSIKETYEKMLSSDDLSETKRNSLLLKLQIVESSIKTLKPKIDHEPGTNL